MSIENMKQFMSEAIPDQAAFTAFIGHLFDVAKPETVYSPPITAGGQTVITANEAWVSMGAGYGGGGGAEGGEDKDAEMEDATESGYGAGGGGGGGGTAWARPVAVIAISDDGVTVEPIVDPTKIAIAFFTTIGAMFLMLGRMRRFGK